MLVGPITIFRYLDYFMQIDVNREILYCTYPYIHTNIQKPVVYSLSAHTDHLVTAAILYISEHHTI
jgi:hypothetical protein